MQMQMQMQKYKKRKYKEKRILNLPRRAVAPLLSVSLRMIFSNSGKSILASRA